jgi:hypothetical protein
MEEKLILLLGPLEIFFLPLQWKRKRQGVVIKTLCPLPNPEWTQKNCKSHHILRNKKKSHISPYLDNEFLYVATTRQDS